MCEESAEMGSIASAALALAMIAAFLLAAGGARLTFKGERKHGLLMVAAAAVLVANVLIWTL